MWKRKLAIVGRSFIYELWGQKDLSIYTSARGVTVGGIDIENEEQLQAFAKAMAQAWKDHVAFKQAVPKESAAEISRLSISGRSTGEDPEGSPSGSPGA